MPLTSEDIAAKLAELENRAKVSEHRIEDLEENQKEIQQLALAMRDITNINNGMLKQLESQSKKLDSQDERLEKLELKPAEKWNTVSTTIVTALISALCGGAVTWFFTFIM